MMTQEQVDKLRLPEGRKLALSPLGCEWLHDCVWGLAISQDDALVVLAQSVANGHLPAAVLDRAWELVDSKG